MSVGPRPNEVPEGTIYNVLGRILGGCLRSVRHDCGTEQAVHENLLLKMLERESILSSPDTVCDEADDTGAKMTRSIAFNLMLKKKYCSTDE